MTPPNIGPVINRLERTVNCGVPQVSPLPLAQLRSIVLSPERPDMHRSTILLPQLLQPHAAAGPDYPLAVDLNGTLISSDTLHEGVVSAFRRAPMQCAKLLATALRR